MYGLISPAARRTRTEAAFAGLYRAVRRQATITRIAPKPARSVQNGRSVVPVVVRTRLFGTLRGKVTLPISARERLLRRLDPRCGCPVCARGGGGGAGSAHPPRAASSPRTAAARRTALGASLAGRAGSRPTGIERIYKAGWRAAPPSGSCSARGDRARSRDARARPAHDIKPALTQAPRRPLWATSSAASPSMRPSDGAILALSGLAVSAPQPPGSTFKIITLSAALQHGIATPATVSGAHLRAASGVRLQQRRRRVLRRVADEAVRELVQLGVRAARRKVGAKRLVGTAERVRLQRAAGGPGRQAEHDPAGGAAASDDLAVGRRGDRPGPRPRHAAADGSRRGDDRTQRLRARPRIARIEPVMPQPRGPPPRSPTRCAR